MSNWITKRVSSKLFWIFVIVIILDNVIFFIPFIATVVLIGLFHAKLLRWLANIINQYCDEVKTEDVESVQKS